MKLVTGIAPRPNWQQLVAADGVPYHTDEVGNAYWPEASGLAVQLDQAEIDLISKATEEVRLMYTHAMDVVANDVDRMMFFGFPRRLAESIKSSWNRKGPTLYGRFDFVLPQEGGIKLYEFNAQTPTSMPECAVAQWNWLEANRAKGGPVPAEADQFNELYEELVEQWNTSTLNRNKVVFVATASPEFADDGGEDWCNAALMCDAAQQAGFKVVLIDIHKDITLSNSSKRFVFTPFLTEEWFKATPKEHQDLVSSMIDQDIEQMFMLWPWEWVVLDDVGRGPAPFGEAILDLIDSGHLTVIEPLHSLLMSSKVMLPVLCELYPGSPYLLDASFGDVTVPMKLNGYVKKMAFAREGANIEVVDQNSNRVADTPGGYTYNEMYILQEYCEMPGYDDNTGDTHYPVIGSWVVGGRSAGLSIRSVNKGGFAPGQSVPITNNGAHFLPHFVV